MRPDGGYVRLYRRIWDNPVFRNKSEAGVFAWMVSIAQWRDTTINTRFGPVKLFAGEMIIAERQVAAQFGIDRNAIQRLLRRMEKVSMICADHERVTSRIGAIVCILNYKEYQGTADGDTAVMSQSRADPDPHLIPSCAKNKEGNTGSHEKDLDTSYPVSAEPTSPPAGDLFPGASVLRLPDVCERAFEAWNALAVECDLSRVKSLSAARRIALRARLRECGGIEGWQAALDQVRCTPFLLGENDRGWKADFDFLMQPKSFAKVIEGTYGNRGAGRRERPSNLDWVSEHVSAGVA